MQCIKLVTVSSIHWYVDTSHGFHSDSKVHSGPIMTMGRGEIVNVSRKDKLNIGSS